MQRSHAGDTIENRGLQKAAILKIKSRKIKRTLSTAARNTVVHKKLFLNDEKEEVREGEKERERWKERENERRCSVVALVVTDIFTSIPVIKPR